MTREEYIVAKEAHFEKIKGFNEEFSKVRDAYIEENAPAKIDQEVRIILNSNRVVQGKVKSVGILDRTQEVYITSYSDLKDSGKTKYITIKHKNVELL